MAIGDYSTTPGNNAAISGINIAEGCAPANVNNAIRQLMADLAAAIGTLSASPAELNILDGATLSTAELNTLDGITATVAELNQLDGLVPAPRPTASAGVGQFTLLAPGAGNALVLGAGGTWAYHGLGTDASGNVVSFFANVAAGATEIQPATGGTNWVACAWRIA